MKTFFVPVLLAVSLTGMAAAQDAAPPAPPAPATAEAAPAPVSIVAPAAPPVPMVLPAPAVMVAQAVPPAPPAPPVPPAPLSANWYAPGKGSYLGVGVQEIDPDRARELKLSEPHGVQVTTVADDSPAAKAGLKEDDVVIDFNGQRVEGVEQFVRLVRETPPGRTVKLLINRNGANRTVTATVGDCKAFLPYMDPKFAGKMRKLADEMARKGQEMEREFGPDSKFRQDMQNQFGEGSQFQRDMQKLGDDMKKLHWDWEWHGPDMAETPGTRGPRLGIESEPVSSQLAEFFGVKQGVLVRSVTEGSGAAKAGIKAGDVIVKVGDSEVGSPRDLTKALRDAEAGKPVPVTVVRNKRQMTLNVTPSGKPGAGR